MNYRFLIFTSLLIVLSCARRGRPEGGPKDEAPPIITKSEPENFSINFTGNEIRIYFDEFIKLIVIPIPKTKTNINGKNAIIIIISFINLIFLTY